MGWKYKDQLKGLQILCINNLQTWIFGYVYEVVSINYVLELAGIFFLEVLKR